MTEINIKQVKRKFKDKVVEKIWLITIDGKAVHAEFPNLKEVFDYLNKRL